MLFADFSNSVRCGLSGRRVPAGRRPWVLPVQVTRSAKLANVCYDIRGPVLDEAMRLEAAGHRILKLNTGNPAPFGFEAAEEILKDILGNLAGAHGYGDAKGLPAARDAVARYYLECGVAGVTAQDV